jgi:hypothetical protein
VTPRRHLAKSNVTDEHAGGEDPYVWHTPILHGGSGGVSGDAKSDSGRLHWT